MSRAAPVSRGLRPSAVALALMLAAAPGGSALARADLASTEFDCLIEPRTVIRLGSEVTGVLDQVNLERGDIVKAGQLVARLQSGVEVATVKLARARSENDVPVKARTARLDFAASKEERTAKLFTKKIVSGEQMEIAMTERRLAELDLSEAEMDRGLAKLQLRQAIALLNQRAIISPIDGVIVERALSPGEFINEQSHVVTIAEMGVLNIEVFIPIAFYGALSIGMRGEVRPEEPVEGVFEATVTIVDELFDPASGTFGVRLQLANADYVLPAGLRCKVRFLAD